MSVKKIKIKPDYGLPLWGQDLLQINNVKSSKEQKFNDKKCQTLKNKIKDILKEKNENFQDQYDKDENIDDESIVCLRNSPPKLVESPILFKHKKSNNLPLHLDGTLRCQNKFRFATVRGEKTIIELIGDEKFLVFVDQRSFHLKDFAKQDLEIGEYINSNYFNILSTFEFEKIPGVDVNAEFIENKTNGPIFISDPLFKNGFVVIAPKYFSKSRLTQSQLKSFAMCNSYKNGLIADVSASHVDKSLLDIPYDKYAKIHGLDVKKIRKLGGKISRRPKSKKNMIKSSYGTKFDINAGTVKSQKGSKK